MDRLDKAISETQRQIMLMREACEQLKEQSKQRIEFAIRQQIEYDNFHRAFSKRVRSENED